MLDHGDGQLRLIALVPVQSLSKGPSGDEQSPVVTVCTIGVIQLVVVPTGPSIVHENGGVGEVEELQYVVQV
jgi:hypothetical protein